MKRKSGNLWVPAQINKVVTIDFVIDSGASDITLPRDVYLTLIRSGTLTKAHYIGATQFGIADGSEVKGLKFRLASLQVGNQVLTDVVASVMPSDTATPLLGLSFLSRFQSWAIDNNSGTLKLTPIGGSNPKSGETQMASANPQHLPLPDQAIITPPTAQPATTPAQMATVTPPQAEPAAAPAAAQSPAAAHMANAVTQATPVPQSHAQTSGATPADQATAAVPPPAIAVPGPSASAAPMMTTEQQLAALNAPRSGRAASSAFIVKETAAPAPAPTPTQATTAVVPVFPANTPYANARVGLLALGYGPALLPDAGKCDSNTDSTCYPERAACVKTDSVRCEFYWRRGEQLIKVRTAAIPPTITGVECQVNCK